MEPTKQGIRVIGDSSSYVWHVYAKHEFKGTPEGVATQPIAYRGPGSSFAEMPIVRFGRTRVLVIQRCGLDI